MYTKQNIIIVGAGPIGCYLAQLLKRAKIEPLLIEEHKQLGRPIHCAGLVGKKVFEEAKISIPKDCILNTINGAIFYVENESIFIKRKEVAYVIDREKFDKFLGKGLEIFFETKFLGLEKENGLYIVETDKGDIKADIVIGADGANSLVRGFVYPNKMKYLKGVQFRIRTKPKYLDMVEVYIKRPYFYWVIPESKEIIRAGVLSQEPYHNLISFIQEKKLKGKILEKFAGIVPLTHFNNLSFERIFLLGDSASQVKPLTYGGIYMGMRAAEVLFNCITNEKFSDYSKLWLKKFGKEISMALKARAILSKLNDYDFLRIISFIKEKKDIIEEKGDFENHSSLVWEFLKQPKINKDILGILLKIIKASLSNEL